MRLFDLTCSLDSGHSFVYLGSHAISGIDYTLTRDNTSQQNTVRVLCFLKLFGPMYQMVESCFQDVQLMMSQSCRMSRIPRINLEKLGNFNGGKSLLSVFSV